MNLSKLTGFVTIAIATVQCEPVSCYDKRLKFKLEVHAVIAIKVVVIHFVNRSSKITAWNESILFTKKSFEFPNYTPKNVFVKKKYLIYMRCTIFSGVENIFSKIRYFKITWSKNLSSFSSSINVSLVFQNFSFQFRSEFME